MGVLDWLSAYIQWSPGWRPWSDYAAADGTTDIGSGILGFEHANVNGFSDVALGAQFEIIGSSALIDSERFRLLWGPLLVIPTPDPDYENQIERAEDEEEWSIDVSNHTFGLGTRLSADVVITRFFFFNISGDFTYHFETRKKSYLSPTETRRTAFGYTLIAETEPNLVFDVDPGLRLGFGLPFRVRTTPPIKLDGEVQDESDSLLLNLSPSVTLYLDAPVVPLQFDLSYTIPLAGRNVQSQHRVALQVTSDFSLF
jgi:hypothetical protein